MKLTCPNCKSIVTAFVRNTYRFEWADTNESVVKRRRMCQKCNRTFVTVEVPLVDLLQYAMRELEEQIAKRQESGASGGGIRRKLHQGDTSVNQGHHTQREDVRVLRGEGS